MADRECPGCGWFYVSDEEDTCPECGCFVPKICPFCGASYDQRYETFCPSCNRKIAAYPREVYSWDDEEMDIADDSEPIDISSAIPETSPAEDEKPKTHTISNGSIVLLCILILLIYYFFFTN
jgi:hypothetical protein